MLCLNCARSHWGHMRDAQTRRSCQRCISGRSRCSFGDHMIHIWTLFLIVLSCSVHFHSTFPLQCSSHMLHPHFLLSPSKCPKMNSQSLSKCYIRPAHDSFVATPARNIDRPFTPSIVRPTDCSHSTSINTDQCDDKQVLDRATEPNHSLGLSDVTMIRI